ncbi:hypothetical protein [Salipaludibacillus daqingensis]|uniref:hypothetical protein n=1 Tax=Salipaludibacillus daqingensis TaxID=3041001 RepID=UPI002474DE79|nr:hypothetical protein [Salipaludibacillus daqingensis]
MSMYKLIHFFIVLLGIAVIISGQYFQSAAIFIIGALVVIPAILINHKVNNPPKKRINDA